MNGSLGGAEGVDQTAEAQLEEGKRLFQQGDRAGAESLFKRIVQLTPYYEDAWLWLAYLAQTDRQRLNLLREASLFVPDSERIQQAQEWAREQYRLNVESGETPLQEEEREDATRLSESRARRSKGARGKTARAVTSGLNEMASDAGDSVRSGFEGARQWTSQAVTGATERLGGVGVYLISVVGIAAIVFLVFSGFVHANKPPISVSPMILPTLVVDATPTPTMANRISQERVKKEVAWTKADWNGAVRALETILTLSPEDEQAREELAEALRRRALDFVDANELEAAKVDIDRAIKCNASNAEVRRLRNDLEGYLEGVRYYQSQQWLAAVDVLTEVYEKNAGFRDTASLLAECHRQLGEEALNGQDWYEAQSQYETCLGYVSGDQSCLNALAKVNDIITPPTRIEVSLSKFHCDVYENGEIIKSFAVCVGRPSSPTVPGRYEILDKIKDDAYASTWDLIMPYWMGIYWAGGSENGFHAYPLRGGSQVLWRGALGTGCSFGCIVLDNYDAEWLYNWAEVGTVVFVRK